MPRKPKTTKEKQEEEETKEQAEQNDNIIEVMEAVYNHSEVASPLIDKQEQYVFSILIGAILKQRQYSESEI